MGGTEEGEAKEGAWGGRRNAGMVAAAEGLFHR